jgi:hypothetical protein
MPESSSAGASAPQPAIRITYPNGPPPEPDEGEAAAAARQAAAGGQDEGGQG